MMSVHELEALAKQQGIEIGGHTVDHPRLSVEDCDSQMAQVCENRIALQWITGRQLTAFSYPFGTRRDFTDETAAIVRAAGYEFACANFEGGVTAGSALFSLPRMIVRNWSGEQFRRQLDSWMRTAMAHAA
jgi:peptidoglycan/xylan/chitin deacetylase (PgdA/CDA1 family)